MKKVLLIVVLVVLFGCGGEEAPSGPVVAEQSDWFDGVHHRFYRYTGNRLGYATSLDGLSFEPYGGNPLMEDSLFPYQVEYEGNRYLIVQHRSGGSAYYLYDVNVPTSPRVLNGGRPILVGEFFNVGVAVKGDRWHMLVEGKSGEVFHLRYTWADFPDLDFNANLGPVVIDDAGNPFLAYIPERDAILAFYGSDYGSGKWVVRAATYDFSEWRKAGFVLSEKTHLADPDFSIFLTCGYGQDSVSTYRFDGDKLALYDAVVAGHVELECLGVTMRP